MLAHTRTHPDPPGAVWAPQLLLDTWSGGNKEQTSREGTQQDSTRDTLGR